MTIARRCGILALACLGLTLAWGCAPRSVTAPKAELSPVTMKVAWVCQGGPAPNFEVRTLDVLPGRVVLLGSDIGGDDYLISSDNGRFLVQLDPGDRQLGYPADVGGDDHQLYTIGYPDQDRVPHVWALDPRTGRRLGDLPLRGRVPGRVKWYFDDGWLFANDYYGITSLTAVDLAGWRVAWNWRPRHPSRGGTSPGLMDMAVGRRLVAMLIEDAEREGWGPQVCLLDRASGRLLSTRAVLVAGGPRYLTRAGPLLYLVQTDDKTVSALNLDTGEELWQYRVPDGDEVRELLGFGDSPTGKLLVKTAGPIPRAGSLHLLDAKGRHLWSVPGESLGFPDRHSWVGGPHWRPCGGGVIACLWQGDDIGAGGVFAISEATGQVLWRRSFGEVSPEFAPTIVQLVRGDYRSPLLLELDSDKGGRPPFKVSFAALDPATGVTTARVVNPAGIAVSFSDLLAASDGERVYVFDYLARRPVALELGVARR